MNLATTFVSHVDLVPGHDSIALRAFELRDEAGRPAGRDETTFGSRPNVDWRPPVARPTKL